MKLTMLEVLPLSVDETELSFLSRPAVGLLTFLRRPNDGFVATTESSRAVHNARLAQAPS
jgi:hypothetical protein